MPHDSRRACAKIFMPLIKLGPGLGICQAWGSRIYLPKGLYHFSQCLDILKRQS